jgi:hypothetical protein
MDPETMKMTEKVLPIIDDNQDFFLIIVGALSWIPGIQPRTAYS